MTKALKELVIVLVSGAGALYVLWGATFMQQPIGDIGPSFHQPDWTAIGIGLGLIAVAVLMGFFVKPKKA
jgi:hypothetical protein